MFDLDEEIKKFRQYYQVRNSAEKDLDEAYKIAQKVAKHDADHGNYLFGICYEFGMGVEKDLDEALRYFSFLVGKNDSEEVIHRIGNIYAEKKEYEKTIEMYTISANLGYVLSMRCLANLYSDLSNEHKITVDYEKASHYYKLAADKGDQLSAERYANMLVKGLGVPQNKDEALRYYGMANTSESAQIKIEMLNHTGSENELIQKVNAKFVSPNPLRKLKKDVDEVNWAWGKIFYYS